MNFKPDYYNDCKNDTTKAMKAYMAKREKFTPRDVALALPSDIVTHWGNPIRHVRYHMGKIVEDGEII
jgi:hypothetical protein